MDLKANWEKKTIDLLYQTTKSGCVLSMYAGADGAVWKLELNIDLGLKLEPCNPL